MAQYSDVVCDSRQVTPGALFVAIPGTHEDGARFIADARARGAKAVMGACPGCDIHVANPRDAFATACANHFGNPSSKLLLCGITGTNGKTTTARLLRDMMAQGGLLPGLLTTVANQWQGHDEPADRTTPDARTLQASLDAMVRAGCRAASMEVSSHAIDQARIGGCRFSAVAFTNLTQDHLDYHHTMEAYYAVKRRLFLEHPEAAAVINVSDPYGRRLLDDLRATGRTDRLFPYDPSALSATFSAQGIEAEIPLGNRTLAFKSALCGRFNLANLLCAATIAHALGISPDAILTAIADSRPCWGRLELAAPRVFVDYAHTDDALTNVLSTLREITPGKLICVFGCGGDRDRTKRPKMAKAVEANADIAIVTSDNPRFEEPEAIIADILTGFSPTAKPIVIPDRHDAIQRALELQGPEDVVLIAGKGHETYQEIRNTRHPFSDIHTIHTLAQPKNPLFP